MGVILADIDEDLVKKLASEFDSVEKYRVVEEALRWLFDETPGNDDLRSVLLKVVAVNSLYSTQVFATFDLATHIVRSNLDRLLDGRAPKAVEAIAHVEFAGKKKRLYSFASKYCSWHRPDNFPIMDRMVKDVLWAYREPVGLRIRRADLEEYEAFCYALEQFVGHYGLASMKWKDLDKGLWMLGRQMASS